MRGDFGWLMAVAGWSFALRMVFKPVGKFFEDYIAKVGETEGKWAVRLLSSPGYKFTAFLIDYLASVKLPSKPVPAIKAEQDGSK